MRILLISTNPISKTNSNGKTISNLLASFPENTICNYFISNSDPNLDSQYSFFYYSPKQVLKSFFKHNQILPSDLRNISSAQNKKNRQRRINKTGLMALIRDSFYWSVIRRQKSFLNWFLSFNPDVIIYQIGDSSFLNKLASLMVTKYKKYLVTYNSENYCFKKYDYMTRCLFDYPFYFFFHNSLLKSVKNIYKQSDLNFFLTEDLMNLYKTKFSLKNRNMVISNSTSVCELKGSTTNCILYAGNLSNERWKTIIKVARITRKINPELIIKVFSATNKKRIQKKLEKESNINFLGFVPYETIKKEMCDSCALLYVEPFKKYYVKDLQYAFSTKIPDSLASGKPLIAVGPSNLSSIKYLKAHQCSFIVENKKKIKNDLTEIICKLEKSNWQNQYRQNALKIVETMHNKEKNSELFKIQINDCLKTN